MPTVVGVKLRGTARPVLFDTQGLEVKADDIVTVVTERGNELGRVASEPRDLAEGETLDDVSRIQRTATDEDLKTAEDLHRREKEAMPVYRRLVAKHGLEMKPIDVECLFEGGRMIFYFVAEERVDFRELVRDLASEFHSRVDMRQVGVRDEARMIGGLGHCGEQLCCARMGGEFQPVSIRMAKEQDLPLNPLKISGVCGRLMCCLRYEFEAYKDFKGRAPRKGAIVEVGEQKGKVVDFNTPKERITLRLEQGGSITVDLTDMDCASGQGCPCRVKAEALDKPASAMSEAVAAFATLRPAASSGETAAPAARGREAAATTDEAVEGARTGGRRRRRGGGSGGGASGGSGEAPKAASGSGGQAKRQGAPRQSGGGRQQQAPRQAPAAQGEQGPATGAPSTSGRRRRRRRSGGGGDAAAGSPPV